ncbi:hypothetical protein [Marinactinospora rubrisoli]|uniref:Uncharacterized protein n=1 Tax=Marinactinospora rubrisoli TaxID=2715399 RepID=A0ABW2KR36_9ACTN
MIGRRRREREEQRHEDLMSGLEAIARAVGHLAEQQLGEVAEWRLEEATQELEEVRSQLDTERAASEELTDSLRAARAETEMAEWRLEELTQELEEVRSQLDRALRRAEQAETEVRRLAATPLEPAGKQVFVTSELVALYEVADAYTGDREPQAPYTVVLAAMRRLARYPEVREALGLDRQEEPVG